jgi:predicted small lipoprotein YifL
MTLTKVFCASVLALVLLVSAGCGQKGPLTLPNASAS